MSDRTTSTPPVTLDADGAILPFDATFTKVLEEVSAGVALRVALAALSTSPKTFYAYLARSPDASERYARAKLTACTAWADETQEIADEEPPKVQTENGEHTDAAFVQWQRLRVDTRKWHLSKLLPKVYGDLVHLEHSGNIGNALAERLADGRKRLAAATDAE